MIDQWFKKDVRRIFEKHPVAVFIDESGDAEFLLQSVKNECIIHRADSEIEELHVKYLIERERPLSKKYLIYTCSPKDKMTFIREYFETNGCIEIRYLQNYIKEKVHQTLNLNINLSKEELITAAKMSVGKDKIYWMDIAHKGSAGIFDLTKELLPFIHAPHTWSNEKYDACLRKTFYQKVNDLLGQDYMDKPATTLAGEVATAMLNGLARGDCHKDLETVYKKWLDSVAFKDSFMEYLDGYSLPKDIDILNINANHPFREIDEQWLADVGSRVGDKGFLPNFLARVRQRNQSKQALALGIVFWKDVIALLEFNPKDMAYLSSFSECVEFYKKHFFKLDAAIRNLYAEFLNKKNLLEPFQELYKEYVSIFLDRWFKYWSGYKETQTGALQRIIDGHSGKTAVIVGDGISYEIAEQVAKKVKGSFNLTRDSIIADIPSETENNMSRIYMANGSLEAVQSNREKYLAAENPDIDIDFIRLDEVNEEARPGQFLICTYRDIDDIGEKLQQKGLKHFPKIIDFFAEKISLLLKGGYEKVCLITDHGFVLTGLLSEADKISVSLAGDFDKSERYIRTQNRQADLTPALIESEQKFKQFNYLYFAQTIHPFKTPGAYGFSHGGICPQELVTPFFCWEKSTQSAALLSVIIENKSGLSDVTGELFQIKIRSDKGGGDFFSMERTVSLVFFANKTQFKKSDDFTIRRDKIIIKEYSFDGKTEIDVHLLDAATKQQLDRAMIRRNKDRDLGGLF